MSATLHCREFMGGARTTASIRVTIATGEATHDASIVSGKWYGKTFLDFLDSGILYCHRGVRGIRIHGPLDCVWNFPDELGNGSVG